MPEENSTFCSHQKCAQLHKIVGWSLCTKKKKTFIDCTVGKLAYLQQQKLKKNQELHEFKKICNNNKMCSYTQKKICCEQCTGFKVKVFFGGGGAVVQRDGCRQD